MQKFLNSSGYVNFMKLARIDAKQSQVSTDLRHIGSFLIHR